MGLRTALSTHIPTSRPQGLRREIQAHGPRLEEVLERAGALASLRSPEAEAVRRGQEQLQGAWAGLREAAERRQQVLDAAFQVEQYYFDVAEVEAWLGPAGEGPGAARTNHCGVGEQRQACRVSAPAARSPPSGPHSF